jgi:hypothetical protein
MTMNPLKLSAKSLKCTVVVDPEGLAGVTVPPGSPRVPFEVSVGGRLVRGELNPKTLRRAVASVAARQCSTVIIQGRLDGDTLVRDLGRSRRVKTPDDAWSRP